MLCDGDLWIHCMHIDGRSHLGVKDQSSGSKWHVWFLQRCWLRFRSDIVGDQWGIHCVFSSSNLSLLTSSSVAGGGGGHCAAGTSGGAGATGAGARAGVGLLAGVRVSVGGSGS